MIGYYKCFRDNNKTMPFRYNDKKLLKNTKKYCKKLVT